MNPARSPTIDVLRGLTLALMIVVNMSISEEKSYAQLLHAPWHGLTLTDLVFPSFLFAVGLSMAWALDKYRALGTRAVLGKVGRRSALIFLCGFLLYWFPFFRADASGQWALIPLETARIFGVLQRIALCYGLAALVLHFGGLRAGLSFSVTALLVYWWIMSTGGDYSLQGNAARAFDLALLGPQHLYQGEGLAFDPEGILGTLPATVHVIAGYAAARWLQGGGAQVQRVLWLAGLAAVAAALVWASVFPINKKLWTSSYVLCTIGIDCWLLALLHAALPAQANPRWAAFFVVFGRNTLFLYLFAEVLMAVLWLTPVQGVPAFEWIHSQFFAPWAGAKNGSLAFALVFMLGCWAVGWWMDRRGVYIKL